MSSDFRTKLVKNTLESARRTAVLGLLVLVTLAARPASGQVKATWTNLHPASSLYSYCNSTSGAQQGGQIYVGADYHAAVWLGPLGSLVDLHPGGATSSWVNGVQGGKQVGYVILGNQGIAALWSGTAGSFTNLNPTWAKSSEALGVFGSQQVGLCSLTNASSGVHAALWTGSANSCVDLHPASWKSSRAFASNGTNQVGYVEKYGSGNLYAAIWSGSAASFIELGPEWLNTTVTYSCASAIGGTNQAGSYQLYNQSVYKAALWSGTPQSFVSLHPDSATASSVWATTDTLQAGTATVNGQLCLGIWRGTPESFVNLGPFATGFGSGVTNISVRAMWIEGNTIHLAGHADSQAITCTIQLLPANLNLVGVETQGGAQVVTLTWTNNGVPAILESSDALASAWGMAAGLRTTNANSYSAVVTNTASQQFFRLRRL